MHETFRRFSAHQGSSGMSDSVFRVITTAYFLGVIWLSALAPAAHAEVVNTGEQWDLQSQTAQAGPVTIKVSPQPPGEGLAFTVVLDTHAVDLDRYDLSQLATVRNDQGTELQPERWDAPKGGHHREGALVFSVLGADGTDLLAPGVVMLELVMRDVGGVPEMVFHWTVTE